MAVQSDDTPAGRPCEQCAAEALNGGVKHSPPYIWNNSNYLLKMTEDLAFLAEVDPLVAWLGAGSSGGGGGGDGEDGVFDLNNNPFLLADPEEEEDDEGVTEEVKESLPSTLEKRRGWEGWPCVVVGMIVKDTLRLARSPFSLAASKKRSGGERKWRCRYLMPQKKTKSRDLQRSLRRRA